MNDFILQYNVNNHILDDAHFLRWTSVWPDSETVSLLRKGLLNLEPPLCSSGYAPGFWKTDQDVTFGISRKFNTDFKYSSRCNSLVLDCSHARYTV